MKLSPALMSLASAFQIPLRGSLVRPSIRNECLPTTTKHSFSTSAPNLAKKIERPKVDKRI
ncbi:MAG: hypothetical protein Q9203_007486, partial [Teloschistes exilis]